MDWLEGLGDWLILLSAHTWALYTIITRDLSRKRNPLAVTLYVFIPTLVAGMVYSAASDGLSPLHSLPGMAWGALLFLGVLGTLAQWFWQYGVARLGVAEAGRDFFGAALEPIW